MLSTLSTLNALSAPPGVPQPQCQYHLRPPPAKILHTGKLPFNSFESKWILWGRMKGHWLRQLLKTWFESWDSRQWGVRQHLKTFYRSGDGNTSSSINVWGLCGTQGPEFNYLHFDIQGLNHLVVYPFPISQICTNSEQETHNWEKTNWRRSISLSQVSE